MKPIYFLIPLIGAAIGWGTNFLAIKMLFRPRYERKLFGLRIQGIFPKRKTELAEAIGSAVEKELVRKEDLAHIISKIGKEKVGVIVDRIIDDKFRLYKLNSIFLINEFHKKLVSSLKSFVRKEVIGILQRQKNISLRLAETIDIKNLVTERINGFSSEELERATFAVINKELRFIELLGAGIGFLIGLGQLVIYFL